MKAGDSVLIRSYEPPDPVRGPFTMAGTVVEAGSEAHPYFHIDCGLLLFGESGPALHCKRLPHEMQELAAG